MSNSSFCYLCGKPIKFDNEYINERTGKKIPQDAETNEHASNHSRSNSNHYSSRSTKKGDVISVTKAAARKSILMQITRLRAANGFL
jgi:hypothetical protein